MSENKPKLSRIPKSALWAMGEGFTFGDEKHGPYGWKEESHTLTQMLDKVLRHVSLFLDGEDLDGESKKLHLGHALADLAIAVDLYYNMKNLDDRWKKQVKDNEEYKTEVEGEHAKAIHLTKGMVLIHADGTKMTVQTEGTFFIKPGSRIEYEG